MKKKLQQCSQCNEETWHMIGKKQAHDGDRWYIRRTTCECIKCGKREINNRENGKRIKKGRNQNSSKNSKSSTAQLDNNLTKTHDLHEKSTAQK